MVKDYLHLLLQPNGKTRPSFWWLGNRKHHRKLLITSYGDQVSFPTNARYEQHLSPVPMVMGIIFLPQLTHSNWFDSCVALWIAGIMADWIAGIKPRYNSWNIPLQVSKNTSWSVSQTIWSVFNVPKMKFRQMDNVYNKLIKNQFQFNSSERCSII